MGIKSIDDHEAQKTEDTSLGRMVQEVNKLALEISAELRLAIMDDEDRPEAATRIRDMVETSRKTLICLRRVLSEISTL